jgi:ADP-L-glycero-D-manno-heptose 6-epimerase
MSKYMIDTYCLENKLFSPSSGSPVMGLRFFNVWGPREHRKGKMASFMTQNYESFQHGRQVQIFSDGEHEIARDFIYVEDACRIIAHFMNNKMLNGIVNVGTGKANSFLTMASAMFSAFDKMTSIFQTDFPDSIDLKGYQWYTCADISMLRERYNYEQPFMTINEAAQDYATRGLE